MSDSDSETDLFPNNVLTYQNQNTMICAKGPNVSRTNISSLSFRSNTMTGMNMPWNVERPRYAASVCDPRSVGYRREREVSPMSCRSAASLQPRNFHHSYYRGGSSSYGNMYNGRSGSPISMRSSRTIDSNTTVGAKDIVFAFQNSQFSKFEEHIIKAAYNKYMTKNSRKRIDKKRNINMLKSLQCRNRSGGESGDQASISSISDDDCGSIKSSRSTLLKSLPSCRSNITNMSGFRKQMREYDLVQDCTDEFRQHTLPVAPQMVKEVDKPRWQSTLDSKNMSTSHILLPAQRFNQSPASTFTGRPVDKPRWQSTLGSKNMSASHILLPAQIFNQSTASTFTGRHRNLESICEDNMLDTRTSIASKNNQVNNISDSEHDDIFGETTVMAKNSNGKRHLEQEDVPDSKRTKVLSHPKNNSQPNTPKQKQLNTSIKNKSCDFEFAKPHLPIKKLGIVKRTQKIVPKTSKTLNSATNRKSQEVKDFNTKPSETVTEIIVPNLMHNCEEKVISSSITAKPTLALQPKQSASRLQSTINEQDKEPCPRAESTQFSTTDMSMRPSFIKRKLFSQKIDETAKNSSSDSLQADSPQNNIYSKIQKEKNRARKLASQSCLNRDVRDDSNLLDLIHKIVPAERMNATAVSRSELPNNKSKPNDNIADQTDKWDVTSIISTCNNGDVSDTYTDEDIFEKDDERKQEQTKATKQKLKGKSEEQKATKKQNKTLEIIQTNNAEIKQNKYTKPTADKISCKVDINTHGLNKSMNQDITVATKTKNNKQLIDTSEENNNKVALKQNTATASKIVKAGKQQKTVVDKEIDGAEIRNNPTTPASKTTPAKFLVVLQKLSPEHVNELPPSGVNGVMKSVRSFWDDDTESEYERTPVKKSTQTNSVVSRPLVSLAAVDTVIEDVSSVSKLMNSSNCKALSVTLQKIQAQACGNKKQTAPEVQKATTNTKQTRKQNPNMDEGANNKSTGKVPAKTTDNSKPPVETFEQTNKTKEALASKENEPPANKTCNKTKTPKSKQKLDTTQKKVDKDKVDTVVGEYRHVKVRNSTLTIRPQRAPKGTAFRTRCCDDTESSANDSSLYRSLRSRQVDISPPLKPDCTKKPPPKKNRTKLESKEEINISDLSFTLNSETPATNRTIKTRSTAFIEDSNNKSNPSFTLLPDKSMNDTTSSRSSKSKRRGEVELLQESFYSTFKRSPLSKKIAPETLTRNRSRTRR